MLSVFLTLILQRHDIPEYAVPCLHYQRFQEQLRGEAAPKLLTKSELGCPETATPTVAPLEPSDAEAIVNTLTGNAPVKGNNPAVVEENYAAVGEGNDPAVGEENYPAVGEENDAAVGEENAPSVDETGSVCSQENAPVVVGNTASFACINGVAGVVESSAGTLEIVTNTDEKLGKDNKFEDASASDGDKQKLQEVAESLADIEMKDSTADSISTPSSTFNTALAVALNIHPRKAPPVGGLAGTAEVRFEQPVCVVLNPEEMTKYCSKRFEFKTVIIPRHLTWKSRRTEMRKNRRHKLAPEGMKLLSLTPKETAEEGMAFKKRKWMMNPKGKSSICILHEYVQYILKAQPEYVFKEMDNSSSPYAAAVYIDSMEYATGYGSSKKQAKADAAKKTLEILMPELGQKLNEEANTPVDSDLSFFDNIRIEDPNVPELCNKMSELPPFTILLNCLRRNYCLDNTNVECKLITSRNNKNQFEMTVGKHLVLVDCKNKKQGKQKASQALLQKLHPQITSWSSMLRLYGNRSLQQQREKKLQEQEVTLLQNNAAVNQPNLSIINMLKQEMLRLHGTQVSTFGVLNCILYTII